MRTIPNWKSLFAAGLCLPALWAFGDDQPSVPASPRNVDFGKDIHPFFEKYCFDCHDAGTAKAEINLEQFDTAEAFWKNPKIWERVLVQLRDKVMPPAKKKQPDDGERARLAAWVAATLDHPDTSKAPHDPGRTVIHRLSRLEYDNTIRDLLGVETHPANDFPPDAGGGGGFDNNAATLYVPPVLMEKYLAAAGTVLDAAKPERLFTAPPMEGRSERDTARLNLSDLARRAFRRPVAPEEIDRLAGLYDASRQRGESDAEATKLAAKALLISPNFLFRIEAERAGATEPYQVDEFALASRLSYFLWASMPDEELFRLASEKKLHDPQTLDQQVRRMLADPKAHAFYESFASQWLRTKELQSMVAPAPDRYPQYTPALRDAFYAESIDFFQGLLRENRPLTDCLGCDYTYANETLAKFYGVADVQGDQMRRVKLTDPNRGGILGMGGVLALTSYPRRTSPVLRGKWVMEEILGTPPPPPPPEVNTATVGNSDRVKDGLTFRQRLEQHRKDPKCAGCHARMDPLGFGLENFDAIGAWRTEVSGTAVDASGQLVTGEKFSGPA
ncbi:MAG TPA: DUF1592 domain-containing protein, partial [Chthoniobacteraceae bacterium]